MRDDKHAGRSGRTNQNQQIFTADPVPQHPERHLKEQTAPDKCGNQKGNKALAHAFPYADHREIPRQSGFQKPVNERGAKSNEAKPVNRSQ